MFQEKNYGEIRGLLAAAGGLSQDRGSTAGNCERVHTAVHTQALKCIPFGPFLAFSGF